MTVAAKRLFPQHSQEICSIKVRQVHSPGCILRVSVIFMNVLPSMTWLIIQIFIGRSYDFLPWAL